MSQPGLIYSQTFAFGKLELIKTMINLNDVIQLKSYRDILSDDFFHIGVTADLGQIKQARGFGSDGNKAIALQKAISELVERIAFLDFGNSSIVATSNGFAAHPLLDQAINNSVAELIERDVVMTRWMLKIGPTWMEESLVDKIFGKWSSEILPLFGKKYFELKVGVWGSVGIYNVYVMSLKSKRDNWGFSIATKASPNLEMAMDALIGDCRRAATVMESLGHSFGNVPPQISQISSPMDHRTYYFNSSKLVGCDWFFESNMEAPSHEPMPRITTEEIILNIELPWSLKVARSSAPTLQQYFVGYPNSENINFSRLQSLGILGNQINQQLHPLA